MAEPVRRRRVDPIDPELHRVLDRRHRFRIVLRSPSESPFAADGPGAEAHDGDVESRIAQSSLLHPGDYMKRVALAGIVMALAAFASGRAQAPPLHFHHVHLNSVNPAAAADYYPKPFALSATRATFNGYETVKTGNVYILFTKVAAPPQNEITGPQTSVWHFGWNTPNSRQYDERFR